MQQSPWGTPSQPGTGSTGRRPIPLSPPSPTSAAHQGDEGTRITGGLSGHDLQTDRVGPDTVASGERTQRRELVRGGVKFEKGVVVERTDEQDEEVAG